MDNLRIPIQFVRHGLSILLEVEASFVVSGVTGFIGGIVILEGSRVIWTKTVGVTFVGLEEGLVKPDVCVRVHALSPMGRETVEYIKGKKRMGTKFVMWASFREVGRVNDRNRFREGRI